LRFVDAAAWCDKGDRPAIQHLIDQQIHQHTCLLDTHIRRADLPFDLGADVPHLPGGAGFLHYGQDVIGRLCDPAGVGDRGGRGRRRQRRPDHRRDGLGPIYHGCGFLEPGRALLGQ